MEQQIQDLIASIKKDGIESATNESKKILEEARKEAERIVSEAKKERDKIIADGKKTIEIERESSISSVKQAARDVSLTLRKNLEEKFQKILGQKVSAALDEKVLAEAIVAVVKGESNGCDVEVSKDMVDKINAILTSQFSKDLENGVTLRASSSVTGGFKVYSKDGSSYIDLSDEEITKLLYPYLSSSLKEMF
ncbi:MAG: hypothetical protein MSS69_06520 [Spirochaetales bacterium]|nr:hypothetical protein [Spirochaetales bacterium]